MKAALALAMLLAFACAPVTDGAGAGASSTITLDGTAWTLATLRGNAPAPRSTVTLKFDGQSASGSTGCNQYNSRYTSSGTKLTFGLTSVTKRACIETSLNEQERSFLEVLTKVASATASAERLTFRDAADQTLAEFTRNLAE